MLLILNALSNDGYFQKRLLVNADSKGFRETIKAGEIGAGLPEINNTRDYQNVNRKMADRGAFPVASCKDCPSVRPGRAGRSNLLRSAGHRGCAAGKSFLCAGTAAGTRAADNSFPSVPNGASVARG